MRLPNTTETLCGLLLTTAVVAAPGMAQKAYCEDLNSHGIVRVLGALKMAVEGYKIEQAEIAAQRKARWTAYRNDVDNMQAAADRSLKQQAYAQSRIPTNHQRAMYAMANINGCHRDIRRY